MSPIPHCDSCERYLHAELERRGTVYRSKISQLRYSRDKWRETALSDERLTALRHKANRLHNQVRYWKQRAVVRV